MYSSCTERYSYEAIRRLSNRDLDVLASAERLIGRDSLTRRRKEELLMRVVPSCIGTELLERVFPGGDIEYTYSDDLCMNMYGIFPTTDLFGRGFPQITRDLECRENNTPMENAELDEFLQSIRDRFPPPRDRGRCNSPPHITMLDCNVGQEESLYNIIGDTSQECDDAFPYNSEAFNDDPEVFPGPLQEISPSSCDQCDDGLERSITLPCGHDNPLNQLFHDPRCPSCNMEVPSDFISRLAREEIIRSVNASERGMLDRGITVPPLLDMIREDIASDDPSRYNVLYNSALSIEDMISKMYL